MSMRGEAVTSAGRYAILDELGAGGMATVYRAELRGMADFRREVAIKALHPHLRKQPKIVQGFLREARLAARIRHPNVVAVTDVGESAFGVFLVMDYVHGLPLSQLLQRMRGETRRRIGMRCLLDALIGLEAAHEMRDDEGVPMGLVHRDFSPDNILVSEAGDARLTDFGIARTQSGPQLTTQPMVKGKLPYIAPEHARGERLDARSDVWAAGVVASELVTGDKPRDPTLDHVAYLLDVATSPLVPLSVRAPSLEPALADAIDGALKFDPSERTPSARAFREALEAALSGGAIATRDEVAEAVRRESESESESVPESSGIVAAHAAPLSPELPRPSTPETPALLPGAGTATDEIVRAPTRWPLVAAACLALAGAAFLALGRAPSVADRAAIEEVPSRLAGADVAPPRSAPAPSPLPAAPTEDEALPPGPSASAPAPEEMQTITVSTDEPLRALLIGDREIPVDRPDRRFEVEVPSDVEEVSGVTHRGRRRTARIRASRASFRFQANRRAAPGASPMRRVALAGDPYAG